jgi:hypothetical protein
MWSPYQDLLDAFNESRWQPSTQTSEKGGEWTVVMEDSNNHRIEAKDELLSAAHTKVVEKVREAINKGEFRP